MHAKSDVSQNEVLLKESLLLWMAEQPGVIKITYRRAL